MWDGLSGTLALMRRTHFVAGGILSSANVLPWERKKTLEFSWELAVFASPKENVLTSFLPPFQLSS